MNAFENQRKNLDFAETETAMGPLKGLNDRSGCKRSSRSEEHRDWRFVLGMANWANSLPTAQKVLSPCASYWERVRYKATFPASCTICSALTNITLLSTIQRKKLKHLPLPLIHGCRCEFLCPVGLNLPWHHFP